MAERVKNGRGRKEGEEDAPLLDPRTCVPESQVPSPESRVSSPESQVPSPESRVPSPESRIPSPESRIPSPESRLSWYVIQTKPLSEDSVELHLKNASFETFNPKIRTMIRGAKRGVSRVKTLFPSYLFARLNLQDPNLYHMIKYTRGVRKILGDGVMPVPIPDEMVNIIRDRVNDDGVIEQRLTMKKGDAVRIRTGLFRDLVGILEKPVSSAGRVKVLLQIMRQQVRCELSAGEVEKLTE